VRTHWIWQNPNWPKFEYDQSVVEPLIYQYAKAAVTNASQFSLYPAQTQVDVMLDILVAEALKTSAIEGVKIFPEEIRSSLKNQLGLSTHKYKISDKRAEGIASLALSARDTFQQPLTKEILYRWHELLLLGIDKYTLINIGLWRTHAEPMQIISGATGRETVHYEAPPSFTLDKEMHHFIKWFNTSEKNIPAKNYLCGPIRAAIAHLYFECIHPFDDGNGRIGRIIAEKALAQDLGCPIIFSISTTIEANKAQYYRELSMASSGNLDITTWIIYFINMLLQAQQDSATIIAFTLQQTLFWQTYTALLNERQTGMLKRMFKEGAKGFMGGISTKKYMKILDVSKATASRDLTDLYHKGCLKKLAAGGRSTRYELNLHFVTNR